jgi:hypothetical protein
MKTFSFYTYHRGKTRDLITSNALAFVAEVTVGIVGEIASIEECYTEMRASSIVR